MRKILGFVILFIPFVLSAKHYSTYSEKVHANHPDKFSLYGISDVGSYYFSPEGDDQNTGNSPEQAWRSIDKLNSIISTLQPGDVIYFERGGVWNEAEIEISRISGTASQPIVFQAYGAGKEPVITGGKNLSGGFTQQGNIWTFSNIGYSKTGYIMNNAGLLINEKFNRVAIHPNETYYTTTSKGNTSLTDNNRSWNNNELVNGQVVVKAVNWAWSVGQITSNSATSVDFSQLEYNMKKETSFYFLQNVDLGLDKPGEWTFDNRNLKVYYTGDLNAQSVEFPVVDTVLKINDIRNVQFSGIEFRGANGILIDIQKGHNIKFDNCIFRVAGTGIDINGTTFSSFANNHFEHIHTNGLTANGVGNMDIHDNQFNHIHTAKGMNNDYDDWSSSIALANNIGEVNVKYNVFDTVMIAFQTHWAEASWYFERNLIKNYTFILGDIGAVYSGGDWRTDITKSIKKNIFLDAHADTEATIGTHIGGYGHGVYWDYNSNGILVDSNTFINANAAIYSNRNKLNKATNNKFINCAKDLKEIWGMNVYMDNLIDGDNDITQHRFNDNIFVFGKNSNERAFGYHYNSSKDFVWGTLNINNNIYQDPFGKRKIHREINDYAEEGSYSLQEICSRRNFECNSVLNPLAHFYSDVTGISEDEFTKVLYNAEKQKKSFILEHTYIDLEGNIYTESLELEPYETKILFFFSGDVIEDNEDPTVPQNVNVSEIEENSVKLSWNSSSDNIGVKGYNVFLNGARSITTSSNIATVSGLSPSTEYVFEVSAFDYFSNESPKSQSITATTKAAETVDPDDDEPADTTEVTQEEDNIAPEKPAGLRVMSLTSSSADIFWLPANDNVGVLGYNIFINGEIQATTSNISYLLDNLSPGTYYEITITAYDKALNESQPSDILKLTTEDAKQTDTGASSERMLPDVSIIKVINSEKSTETVANVKSMGRTEVEQFGVRVAEDEDFTWRVEVFPASSDDWVVKNDNRVSKNLQLLYNFSRGRGPVVKDISSAGEPLDLFIEDTDSVFWLPGQGLKMTGNTKISSRIVPQRVIDSLSSTNEITVEAWIKPCLVNQKGPARIVSLSSDHFNRAFMLGQGGNENNYDFVVRLNTTNTDANGTPQATSLMYNKVTDLQHVVYTRNGEGYEKLYVDGIKRYAGFRSGDFSSWGDDNVLLLGNELTGDRPWMGSFFLVAVYNQELDQSEVLQNYDAGFGQLEFTTTFDALNSNTSYFLSPFVKTIDGVKYGESINILIPEKNPSLIKDSLSMSVYPNPSDGNFTVSFEHNMPDIQKAQITVMDIYGKTIHSREIYLDNIFFQREEMIELGGPQVTTGIYFVHIHMGEIAETRKIMINR